MRTISFVMIFGLLAVSVLCAAPLASINPALEAVAQRGPSEPSSSGPSASSVTLPLADVTGKKWMFGSVIEASSTPDIRIAGGAQPIVVRLSVEGDQLVVYEDSPLIPENPGVTEPIINRYPCKVEGDKVSVDLGKPEISSTTVTLQASSWDGKSGGQVYDVACDPGYVGWVEKYVLTPRTSDGESVTLFLRMFFKRCDDTGYKAREYSAKDQSQYGYFLTSVPRISPLGEPSQVNLIKRRDAKKPLVYLLHPLVPEKYREAMAQGILAWNDTFQAACGVRPIEVKVGEPNQLASDIRYNVVYWVDHIAPGISASAYGPSTADPRTGEIIQGNVVIFGKAWVADLTHEFEALKKDEAKPASKPKPSSDPKKMTLRLGSSRLLTFDLGHADPLGSSREAIEAIAKSGSPADLDAYICTYLKGVMCHEVGHTLGLRHNFTGSADRANLKKGEVSTSIMDYLDFDKMLAPGSFDQASIAYGYEGDPKLWEGKKFVFFTDEHCSVVPDCNQFDLGDPLPYYASAFDKTEKKAAEAAAKGQFDEARYTRKATYILEHVRKYIGEGSARSWPAFVYMYNQMVTQPPRNANDDQLAHNTARRSVIARLLSAARPETMEGSWSPLASYRPLSAKEKGYLTRALGHMVGSSDDPLALRLNAIDYLKRLQTAEAFGILKGASRGLRFSALFGAIESLGSAKARKAAAERTEIAARLKQVVATYFDPAPAP